jgi:hypothetical protein
MQTITTFHIYLVAKQIAQEHEEIQHLIFKSKTKYKIHAANYGHRV